MRTKNLFSIAALTIFGMACMNSMKAQDAPNSDVAKVNIKFLPIQTIVVNSNQKTVNLVYETVDHYTEGVISEAQENHLTVHSTGGFEVKVKALTDFTSGERTIPAGDVRIIPSKGSVVNGKGAILNALALETTDKILIKEVEGGFGLTYDITYDNSAGAGKYINRYIHNDDETKYTADVTYSIISK